MDKVEFLKLLEGKIQERNLNIPDFKYLKTVDNQPYNKKNQIEYKNIIYEIIFGLRNKADKENNRYKIWVKRNDVHKESDIQFTKFQIENNEVILYDDFKMTVGRKSDGDQKMLDARMEELGYNKNKPFLKLTISQDIKNEEWNSFLGTLFKWIADRIHVKEEVRKIKQEKPLSKKESTSPKKPNLMKSTEPSTQPLSQILYGPPGTGKTYHTIDLAVQIADESRWSDSEKRDENHAKNKVIFDELRNKEVPQIEFVTFHQNYSYEDFMVGIRPYINEDAAEKEELKFVKYEGVFYRMAKEARREENKSKNFVLIIDEINRANISKVFGELITLLEDDKRLGREHELKVTLPNGKKNFGVPQNLYVVGTMNTADKSIALIDIALRRRFDFIGKYPKVELINGVYDDATNKRDFLKRINNAIYEEKKSADWLIGHSYFMNNKSLDTIILKKIIPLLMEYFGGKLDKVTKMLDDGTKNLNKTWKYNEEDYTWGNVTTTSEPVKNKDNGEQQ